MEVKTITRPYGNPLERIDQAKASRLWALARLTGAARVEHLGLKLTPTAIEVEWLPG